MKLVIRAIKIGVGSSLAVVLAGLLGLEYATTTGVITLLTIRNTKKDTVELAVKRLASFVISILMISMTMLWIRDPNIGFGLYMVQLVIVSYLFQWEDSISVNAVIGTHIFIMETVLTIELIMNELGIVVIGTSIAVVVNNFYMMDNIEEIKRDARFIEANLQKIFMDMVAYLECLERKSFIQDTSEHIQELENHIDRAIDKAFENIGNASNHLSKYYVEYLNMRKSQCNVLIHCYRVFMRINPTCIEAREIAIILHKIADSVHDTVGMKQIISELEMVIIQLKERTIPKSQEEFVAKAEIFYILEELEELLRLKSEFIESVSKQEIYRYWI